MSFSAPATGDGPEAEDGLEIPGFPKPHKPGGFAGNLHGHLEKLASNSKSIHHVLEALCGGLDRLEKKMDTNSSQVEARLANIVHHMSGEADEDTMSAWSSLGSPGEMGQAPSLRRRSSFGMKMASFSEDPLLSELHNDQITLDSELAEVGRSGANIDRIGNAFGDVVHRARQASRANISIGRGTETAAARSSAQIKTAGAGSSAQVETAGAGSSAQVENAAAGSSAQVDGDGIVPSDESSLPPEPKTQGEEPPAAAAVETVANTTDGPTEGRRRSNQDDQSSDTDNDDDNDGGNGNDSALSADSSITGGSVREEEQGRERGSGYPPAPIAQRSVESGGSDASYIARQRWIWAFGRVCQLVRRRKRKEFEIMNQRATDRSVRMGSRVSVMEKRLDETKEHLMLVGRLSDKSGAHTAQIHHLNETVRELCKLLGVEKRVQATVEATQTKMETAFKSDLREVEGRLARGHRELETSLEGEIKRNGAKLEDMDDRYARSEETLRRADERIGEVQEEVSAVTHGISEVERQLRVDEERLDSLENLKKAHQRRLSELRAKLEGSGTPVATAGGGVLPIETEPDETDDERMARLLKAAGTATEFLAADLEKILESNKNNTPTPDSSAEDAAVEIVQAQSNLVTPSDSDNKEEDVFEKLRHVSVEAAEFSSLCGMKTTGGGGGRPEEGIGVAATADAAVERAEALCGRIEDLLSAVADQEKDKDDGNSDPGIDYPTSKSSSSGESSSHIGGIVCPNGRRDLPLRLAAARDALVPVIGERASVGGLKVALLGLRSSVRAGIEQNQAAETRRNDLYDRVSGLDKSVSEIKGSLRGAGRPDRMDTFDGGGSEREGVSEDDLEERLGFKADVSWVQRELQRLWDALDTRAMAAMAAMGTAQMGGRGEESRPRSAPSTTSEGRSSKETDNTEMAGEEGSDVTPNSRAISTSLPSATVLSAGIGGGGGGRAQHPERRRSSFNEGSSIIKDLMRKASRLEQQMASKADNDEVTRSLTSIGNKLRKVGFIIPAIQEELANKIEKKDLTKLVAMVSNGGSMSDGPPGGGNPNNNENDNGVVIASRLNSKFRCLSCDRPLPALGPPGPPKLGSSPGLSVAGTGAPRSPQRTKSQPGQQRLRLAAGGAGDDALSRPSSPAIRSPTSEGIGDSDVAGWGGGGGSSSSGIPLGGTTDNDNSSSAYYYGKDKDGGGRRRQQQRGGDQPPGRLEPLGANGEQITGVLSRYPRMMPPPSRVRTAAGGGIGSRPGSSSGGRV